jgi:hypothetical protein
LFYSRPKTKGELLSILKIAQFNHPVYIDERDELSGSVYESLRQFDYFKKFKIKYNTIEWPNGADYAPEYLYNIAAQVNS